MKYDKEWKNKMMLLSKEQLIGILKKSFLKTDRMQKEIEELEDRRDELLVESGSGNLSRGRL